MKTLSYWLLTSGFALALVTGSYGQNKPAGKPAIEFHSVKEVADVLPHSVLLNLQASSKAIAARSEANKILAEKLENKMATLKVHTEDWKPWSGEGDTDKLRVSTRPVSLNVGGVQITARLWLLMTEDQAPALSKVNKGSEVTVIGELSKIELTSTAQGLQLDGGLRHAKIQAH